MFFTNGMARGFYHSKRPPKFRLWMAASIGKKQRSKLIIHSLTDLYGPVGDSVLEISIYREFSFESIKKLLIIMNNYFKMEYTLMSYFQKFPNKKIMKCVSCGLIRLHTVVTRLIQL